MKSIILIILLTIATSKNFCQTKAKSQTDIFPLLLVPGTSGQLIIDQDIVIKQLINKYVDFRKKENRIPGYRIRIYSNSGQSARQNAQNERAKFLRSYSETPTYLEYEAPNFKIYVGDYRNKIEAFGAYKQIQHEYKNAFLVPAKINLPRL